jgi:F-type H+-transporting ATPase subunit b
MNAKLEAAALREKVIADAKELAESKLEAKRAELAQEYKEFEKSLADSKESLKADLMNQVPVFKEAVKAKFSQI